MKTVKFSLAALALFAFSLVAYNGKAKSALIDEGWYQMDQSATPQRIGEVLSPNAPEENCDEPTTQNCVAYFDTDGNQVGAIVQGTFTN